MKNAYASLRLVANGGVCELLFDRSVVKFIYPLKRGENNVVDITLDSGRYELLTTNRTSVPDAKLKVISAIEQGCTGDKFYFGSNCYMDITYIGYVVESGRHAIHISGPVALSEPEKIPSVIFDSRSVFSIMNQNEFVALTGEDCFDSLIKDIGENYPDGTMLVMGKDIDSYQWVIGQHLIPFKDDLLRSNKFVFKIESALNEKFTCLVHLKKDTFVTRHEPIVVDPTTIYMVG